MTPSGITSSGCLGRLLQLFGISRKAGDSSPPYRLRDDFLSPSERSFMGVLTATVGQGFVICPKVNLSDVLFVARPHENRGAMNRIDRKHIDFLFCDSART